MNDYSAHRASVTVALPAVIDLAHQDRAYEQLYAAVADGASVVIADLTATALCDCSSLRRLVAIRHQAAARGGQLRLAITPGSPVHHMAQLMDLDHLLPIYPSVVQAAAAGPLPHSNAPALRHPAAGTAVVADITDLIGADLLHILRWQAKFGEIRRRRRDPASWPALATTWGTLARLIDLHMRAKDVVCVPAICGPGRQGRTLAREIEDAHENIREMIRESRRQLPGSPRWWHLATTALSAWTAQADCEEHGLLAEYRRYASPALRCRLALQWRAFMDAQIRDQDPSRGRRILPDRSAPPPDERGAPTTAPKL
jgi:anti-anti-sigma factor